MDTACSLALRTGKPVIDHRDHTKTKVATFSRFVLPFAYKLEKQQATQLPSSSPLHYKVNPLSDLSFLKRKKYFTRETGRILYGQTLWLDMCENWNNTVWGQGKVDITLRDRIFKVGMLSPRLTLFEAASGQNKNILTYLASQQKADIRHTGFLQLDIYFPEGQENTPELDDLLLFNEMFRYYDMPYDAHLEHYKRSFGKVPVHYSETEPSLTVAELAKDGADSASQRCYFERWANLLEIPLVHNGRLYRLFPKNWSEAGRTWSYSPDREITDENWQIYDDNRTYVWTAAFLKEGGCTLQKCLEPETDSLQAREYGHWIKLLNVDMPSLDGNTHHAVSEFERQWAEQRTYKRWEESGTWYGFCDHGGAVLAPPLVFIFGPVQTYYFDLVMLLHFIRISALRFSSELSDILSGKEEWDTCRKSRENLANLRKKFTEFTVSYRYPIVFNQHVSNQQQLLEMYKLYQQQHESFEIERFFKEVQLEIDNTHEFLELLESTRLANAANDLSTYGIPLAVAAVLASLFAMPDLHLIDWCISNGEYILDWDRILQGSMVIAAILGTRCWLKNKKPLKNNGAE